MQIEFEVGEWLNPTVSFRTKAMVENKVSSERKERLLRNHHSSIDYGFSFDGLDPIKQKFLKTIRNVHDTEGRRPMIADIGAGFGTMTWKILAAGGSVDAFEIQVPSALELQARIDAIDSILWNGEKLEDILRVYAEDVFNVLSGRAFEEKYDFIWISQVFHFLTPEQIEYLRSLFQYALKPSGEVFIETNTFESFRFIDHYDILDATYQRANQKGLAYPGFITFNAATVIDETMHAVVDMTFISAYEQTEMDQYGIAYQTNGYGRGYLGPSSDEIVLNKRSHHVKQHPDHQFSINRFHQIMNLFDAKTLHDSFGQHGFDMTIFYLDSMSHQMVSVLENSEKNYNLAAILKKTTASSPVLNPVSVRSTMFSRSPHHQLIVEIEKNCVDKVKMKPFLEAIYVKNYSLALRKACSKGLLKWIKILLNSPINEKIMINEKSTNGFTALDWIHAANVAEDIKRQIVTLLEERGALTGAMLCPSSKVP